MGVETALLVSSVASAGGAVIQGYQSSKALSNDIARYQDEKKYAELRALQEENERTEAMNIILNNNRAIAGASGILDDSRSFLTIQQDVFNSAKEDISNIKLNRNIATSKYDQQIINSKIQKQSVFWGSLSSASSSALQGWGYYQYYQPGMTPFQKQQKQLKEFNRKYRG
tara:strand:- start:64 stop:573 length:510 start_codon:yes stop_codon:yes gene_type:complete